MKPAVLWTDAATEQLDGILLHFARVSPVYATRLLDRILTQTERLEDFPQLGSRSRRDQARDVRELIEGEYIIFYLPQATRIDILAIVSSRRDLPPPQP